MDDIISAMVDGLTRTYRYASFTELTRERAYEVFTTMDRIAEEIGLSRTESDVKFLNQALKTGVFDCDTSSLIYKAVGDITGVPLEIVVENTATGEHIFVRCRLDNHEYLYWEPMEGEKFFDGASMLMTFEINQRFFVRDELRTLTDEQFLAKRYAIVSVARSEKGDIEKAAEYADKAFNLNPNDAAVLNSKGVVCSKQKEYDKAIEYYTGALSINPDLCMVYFNRGLAFYKVGKYDLAVADFDSALERDPEYAKARKARDITLGKIKSLASARLSLNDR